MVCNRPNKQERQQRWCPQIMVNSSLPVIYLYIKDDANKLMTRFPSTKAKNQKRQSERMKETTLITQVAADSLSVRKK